MSKRKNQFRKPKLIQYRSVWLTQKGYELLRLAKKEEKKSMMAIVNELIKEKYK